VLGDRVFCRYDLAYSSADPPHALLSCAKVFHLDLHEWRDGGCYLRYSNSGVDFARTLRAVSEFRGRIYGCFIFRKGLHVYDPGKVLRAYDPWHTDSAWTSMPVQSDVVVTNSARFVDCSGKRLYFAVAWPSEGHSDDAQWHSVELSADGHEWVHPTSAFPPPPPHISDYGEALAFTLH